MRVRATCHDQADFRQGDGDDADSGMCFVIVRVCVRVVRCEEHVEGGCSDTRICELRGLLD